MSLHQHYISSTVSFDDPCNDMAGWSAQARAERLAEVRRGEVSCELFDADLAVSVLVDLFEAGQRQRGV